MKPPNPGSERARANGCTCPVADNHGGRGIPYPDGARFYVSASCKMHGADAMKRAATSKRSTYEPVDAPCTYEPVDAPITEVFDG